MWMKILPAHVLLMKKLLLIALLITPLVACRTLSFSDDLTGGMPLQVVCPVLVRYEVAYQQQAGRELQSILTTAPNIAQMIEDYRKLRAGCRKLKP